jgi:acetyltransferase-like isoleucine patch superfamily enzyme
VGLLRAIIDTTHPRGIIIGDHVLIARGTVILSHDFVNQRKLTTIIGCNVFIGCNSIILPGVTISNNTIIAAGAVVTKDFTGNGIIVGNPASQIRSSVKIGKYGIAQHTQK